MSASKGIKTFGDKAITAILGEFSQLNDMKVVEPLDPDALTPQKKRDALRTVSLLKEKWSGSLKGRTCADGSKHRKYISKVDSSSPTVSTEALLTTLVIDTYEGREVATADIIGAYLNAIMDEFVVIKIEHEMVEFMVQEDPEKYRKHVRIENGKEVLYVQIIKALYGCMISGVL